MVKALDDLEVEIRPGTTDDVPLLLSMIRELAEFEKQTTAATEDSLRADLFGAAAVAKTLLALVDGRPAGYVIYFFTFASMEGRRALWLEDLFVDAAFRGKGIGKALMSYVANIAVENHCARLEWIVLDWNTSAIEFYEALGADVLPDWRICRVGGTHLGQLADEIDRSPSD